MSKQRIAILIDGGFFLKRLPKLIGENNCDTPEKVVTCIRALCRNHVQRLTPNDQNSKAKSNQWHQHVYRIFFYDADPYDGKAHHPITNRPIDYGKSEVATFRRQLFTLLRKERKLALRLGKVMKDKEWAISPRLTKKLLKTRQHFESLPNLADLDVTENGGNVTVEFSHEQLNSLKQFQELWQSLDSGSVSLGLRQKGVDMRIGVDISSITLKKQADTIVLVSGDSDFVPASKLARREGLEFILDPMWQQVNDDLFEHIDGLQSGLNNKQ